MKKTQKKDLTDLAAYIGVTGWRIWLYQNLLLFIAFFLTIFIVIFTLGDFRQGLGPALSAYINLLLFIWFALAFPPSMQ